MLKSVNKLIPLKKVKTVATTGSSSTLLSSDQQKANNRQPNAPAETGQPPEKYSSDSCSFEDDNGQEAPVESSGSTASTAATGPASRNDNRQIDALTDMPHLSHTNQAISS